MLNLHFELSNLQLAMPNFILEPLSLVSLLLLQEFQRRFQIVHFPGVACVAFLLVQPLLQLLERDLEVLLLVEQLPLTLVLLPFQKLALAFPESTVSIVVILAVLKLPS